MTIEGIPAESLAKRFGTPLYVYSKASLRERWSALREAFAPPRALICYALKANSNAVLCRLFARWGAGAEVVSGGELWLALRSGFDPSRIVFSGVGKTRGEMIQGLRSGILTFNVESAEELSLLSKTARSLARRAPVSLRVNPAIPVSTHRHIATAGARSKFGVSSREAMALCLKAAKDPALRLVGLHCHLGSQIFDVSPYERSALLLARMARDLGRRGVTLSLVDFGGGFGLDEGGVRKFPVPAAARALRRALAPWPGLRMAVEPGRHLTAGAGTLLTRVLYRKAVPGSEIAIVDAGMNDFMRPALYDAVHAIVPARPRPGPRRITDIAGPVCESADFFGRGLRFPRLEPGDVLAVLNAGAYGFSMSSCYNSRPRPAEVLVDGRRSALIRSRESFRDLARHQVF